MAFFTLNTVELTEAQRTTLDALYDTLAPPLTEARSEEIANEYANNDPERKTAIIEFLQTPGSKSTDLFIKLLQNGNMIAQNELNDILFALNLLSTTWGTFLLTGYWSTFASLTLVQREGVIMSLLTSCIEQKRMLANSLRALLLLLFVTEVPSDNIDIQNPFKMNGYNPNRIHKYNLWKCVGYSGVDPNIQPDSIKLQQAQQKYWYLPKFDILQQYHITQDILQTITKNTIPIRTNWIQNKNTCQFDVIIIGSGAGCGPVALQLSQSGYKVLVLEQSSYQKPDDLTGLEAESFEKMYLHGGCLTTSDKSMTVLAGATFGGGTSVNWSASLDTPSYVREEWSNEYGLTFCTTSGFATCLNRIKDIMQVHPHPEHCHNNANSTLLDGANKLGYPARVLNQNGLGEHNCGWCFTGCKYQHKQGTNHSFLPIAINSYGCQVLTDCRVEEILFESFPYWTSQHHDIIKQSNNTFQFDDNITLPTLNLADRYGNGNNRIENNQNQQNGENNQNQQNTINNQYEPEPTPSYTIPTQFLPNEYNQFNATRPIATGVRVLYKHPITNQHIPLIINAKIIVSSAGALQTPLLLQRSHIQHNHIGHNLRLHPVIGLGAFYPDTKHCWKGTQMTSICTVVQNQYKNYGAIIETPNAHLGLMAASLAWSGSESFKTTALKLDKLIPFICLTREMNSSGIVSEKDGKVVINYTFNQQDRGFLLESLIAAIKIHVEAGANEILTPFFGLDTFKPDLILKTADPKFQQYIQQIRSHHIINHSCQLLSAHQMGTARISKNPHHGSTQINGEIHGITNLFIADTSLFPTASGVNPMVTVMTLAQYVSLNIQQRLERIKHIEMNLEQVGLYLYDHTITNKNEND